MRSLHPKTTYIIFTALYAMAFSAEAASYTPFMNSIGISFAVIELLNAAFITANLAAEIPTGMLADGRSRRWSLKMGAFISAVGFATYGTAIDVQSALIAEITIGIGFAFVSGSAQAWVTDALIARGEGAWVRKTFAAATMVRAGGILVSGAAGAWLVGMVTPWLGEGTALRLPWAMSAVLMLMTLGFVHWGMCSEDGEATKKMSELEALRKSITLVRRDRALIWVIALSMVAGLGATFNHFWHPYFLKHVSQPGLGSIWIVISLSLMVGGWFVHRVPTRPRQEIWLGGASVLLIATGLLGLAATTTLPVALLWLVVHEIGRGTTQPIIDAYVQHRVESGNRATFGSLHSVFRHAGIGLAFLLASALSAGKAYDVETVRFVWITAGSLLIILTLLLLALRPRNGKA